MSRRTHMLSLVFVGMALCTVLILLWQAITNPTNYFHVSFDASTPVVMYDLPPGSPHSFERFRAQYKVVVPYCAMPQIEPWLNNRQGTVTASDQNGNGCLVSVNSKPVWMPPTQSQYWIWYGYTSWRDCNLRTPIRAACDFWNANGTELLARYNKL